MNNKYLISLLFIFSFSNTKATHIIGGNLGLKWLHDSTYQIQLNVIRDCYNGQSGFDDTISVGIFSKTNNTRLKVDKVHIDSVSPITFETSICSNNNFHICQEIGYYNKVIIISPTIYSDSNGYYISWERCCRNSIIQNIKDPGISAITFYAEFPSPKWIINSSPKWNNPLPKILCQKQPFNFNFNFTDADGDSLYYSLVTPFTGNLDAYSPINQGNPRSGPYGFSGWVIGFDNLHQIKGSPPLSIEPKSGTITVNPDTAGVYASAILVEEVRSGKQIGEVRLELQFNILNYTPPSSAVKELKTDEFISVYPNPAEDIINVDLGKVNVADEFSMIDVNGKTVLFKSIIDTNILEIHRNSLPSGIYFYKLKKSQELIKTGKIIFSD